MVYIMQQETIEKRIQTVRKQLKLSQEELSTQIGISYRSYSSYERGDRKPSFEFLALLFEKYNINLNWLIVGQGEMFNAPKYDDVKDELKVQVLSILKEQGLI